MSNNATSLINTGVHIINCDRSIENQSRKTIIVSGVARSGTSLVAGVLSKLGVFMGNKAHPPVYEDVELSRVLESGHIENARRIMDEYSEKYSIWGWKRPSSIGYLDIVNRIFTNPVYIFTFKDIFSIANRNRISMQTDLITNMQKVYLQLGTMLDFIEKNRPAGMMVASDKVLLEREPFVHSLCDFLGLERSEDQIQNAIQFIRPNPSDYLDVSRITKARGKLGTINESSVTGWARAVYNEMPINVELFINGKLAAVTTADILRKGLMNQGIHPTGRIGFRFDLDDSQKLTKGDIIRVRAENEVNDLNNSPKVFKG